MPGRQKTGGRKPGSPNKVTAETRERIETKADPIGFLKKIMDGEVVACAPMKEGTELVPVYPTLDQRMSAARILADKQVPNAKGRSVNLELPAVETADDIAKAMGAIVVALCKGQITPDEAELISRVLDRKRAAVDTVEVVRRLGEIETRLAQQEAKP
jgi:hypothetical protein